MLNYLEEIRQRLLKSLACLLVSFLVLFYFGQHLFTLLALPLLKQLGDQQSLVAIGIATPLVTPLKLSFYASLFLVAPFFLYQFWAFLAPALYRHERRLMSLLVFPSVLLFYIGMAFAYFIVFPLVFGFFAKALPEHIHFLPDMAHYLDFVLQLLIAFGLSFQLPVVIVFLAVTELVSLQTLIDIRAYVIVMAFIVGMLLTPPDVLSQILLALPLYGLYEIALLVIKIYFVGKDSHSGESHH